MEIKITLTMAGVDTDFFSISASSDGIDFGPSLVTHVSRIELISGYTLRNVPNDTIKVRVKSNTSTCNNFIDIDITNIPSMASTNTVTPFI